MSPRVILASQSPRRQELLKHIYKVFEIVPSFADEDIDEKDPGLYVEKLSRLKAREVYDRVQDEEDMVPEVTGMKRLSKLFKSSGAAATDDLLVIGADTIVVRDGEILGKPKDEEDAFNILKSLQRRSHEVYTGVTLLHTSWEKTFHEKTVVNIASMTDEEIKKYIATGDPMDKAGAYGIQTLFTKYVTGIEGDYNNVVGLPVAAIYRRVKEMNL
ncbi:MAG: septum formation protein Maf [Eubacterium sp.]|nr:septum formation protein Maf [Eubacterium sp.]